MASSSVPAPRADHDSRLRVMFEQSSAGIVELDLTGGILGANQRFCTIVGRPLDQLLGLSLDDITHPEDRRHNVERLVLGANDELPAEGWTKRYVRSDGRVIWARVSGSLVRDAAGAPLHLVGVVQDISELVEAQQAVAHSRSHLLAFVEHAPAAVAMLDRELRYIAVSRRWAEDYGLGARDLVGMHHYDVFPEIRDLPEWQAIHQRCLAGAVERRAEDHFVRTDGRDEWLQWEVRPWMDERGAIGGIMMLTEVITPRKLAAQALAESEQRLQLALTNARHGLWDWDIVTGRLYVDDQWARIVGYERDELAPDVTTWVRLLHPDDALVVRAELDRALASDEAAYDVDYRAKTKQGDWIWVNTRGRVQQRDAAGRPLRMMGTIHDISERKAAEEKIRESLRVNEVLLREVHHRVKNNLAAIGSLFYLQSRTTTDPATLGLLEDSRNRIHSMALVHELLYRASDLAAVDLAEYTGALANHLVRGYSHGTQVALTMALEPLTVDIDRAIPCGLVLNEMLTNVLKHAFRGRAAGAIAIALEVRDGRCRLSVTDDGAGVSGPLPDRPRSLGLRLMHSLASQLEGRFTLEARTATPPGPGGTGTRAVLEFGV